MTERHRIIIALACGTAIAATIVLTKQHQRTPAISLPSATPGVTNRNPNRDSGVDAPERSQSPALALADRASSPSPLVRTLKPTAAASDAKPNLKPHKKSSGLGTPHPPPLLVAPEARIALAFVGTDADAESVWFNAINDPFVPPNERKDLIEDLNEDGFADPHHIAPDEMPLVLSRIKLIEQLAPSAVDDTNAAAFQEAYKDLTNMLTDPNPK
jgi:hypothetical protein